MIRELLIQLYNDHRALVGSGAVLVLFFAALLYAAKSEKRWVPLLLSPLPAAAAAITETLFAFFAQKGKSRPEKIFTLILSVCLIALVITSSGGSLVHGEYIRPASNDMHIPGDLEQAMTAILDECEQATVCTMPGWGPYFTAYSSRFEMMYDDSRGEASLKSKEEMIVYTQLSVAHPDMRSVAESARRRGCGYIVLSNDIWPEIPVTSFGYEPVYEGGTCTAYREVASP